MLRAVGRFAVLASVAGASTIAYAAEKKVIEPFSKTEFDETESFPFVLNDRCQLNEQKLAGVGVRCMMQLCFWPAARAYAVAFYGSPSIIANPPSTRLQVPWSIELEWLATMRASHIGAGFKKNILPKLKALPTETAEPAIKHLDELVNLLSNQSLANLPADPATIASASAKPSANFIKGERLAFTWSPQSKTLLVSNQGKVIGQLQDEIVASCLLDCYVSLDLQI